MVSELVGNHRPGGRPATLELATGHLAAGRPAVGGASPPSCCCSSSPRNSRPSPREPARPVAQRVGAWCPGTPLSLLRRLVLGSLAPAGLPARGRGSLFFFSAPFLFARLDGGPSEYHEYSFSSTARLSTGGLSHQARPFFRGGSSHARLPLAGGVAGDLGRRDDPLLAAWLSFHAATPCQPCHGSVGS